MSSDLGTIRPLNGQGKEPETQYVCPLPRRWYPAGSACNQTDDLLTGPTQEPWVPTPPAAHRQTIAGTVKFVFWIGTLLVFLNYATRILEAWSRLQPGSTRS